MTPAQRVLERADVIAGFSEEPGRITRPLGTPALAAAMEQVADWMYEAGLETASDGIGNLVGRRGEPPRLLMGSHLDTVADAGRYDGVLGVLVAIEVADATTIPLEVVAFADEEGLRYGSTFLGSRAFVGRLTAEEAALLGVSGPPLYAGAKAYLEVHIEQGPVLQALDAPLGVVTAIAGQSRYALEFTGHADHAGTTPMAARRDALAAAAEFVLAAEQLARETPDLVATVGTIGVPGGAVNVVPGRAQLTLDVRHPDDSERSRAISTLQAVARPGIDVRWTLIHEHDATPCASAALAPGAPRLVSGAGHDVVTMAEFTDVALLFVRSDGGSHNPGEAVDEADVAAAIEAATRYACSI